MLKYLMLKHTTQMMQSFTFGLRSISIYMIHGIKLTSKMAPIPLWLRFYRRGSLDRFPGYRVHYIKKRGAGASTRHTIGYDGYYVIVDGYSVAHEPPNGRNSRNPPDVPSAPTPEITNSGDGAIYFRGF